MLDEPAQHVDVVVAVVGHFRHRAVAEVEVAREAGCSRFVFGARPGGVVLFGESDGVLKPGARCAAARGKARWIFVDGANHRGEEGWLRAREVVCAVGVENAAVMLDLEEKVVDHAFGESFAVIGFEAEDDEVAVPAVHLVKAAAGHDVGVGKIEEPFGGKFLGAHIADLFDAARKRVNRDVALLFERGHFGRRRHLSGHVEHRMRGDLDVDERMAVGHRAREGFPCAVNVIPRGAGIGGGIRRGLSNGRVKRGGKKQQAEDLHGDSGFWVCLLCAAKKIEP